MRKIVVLAPFLVVLLGLPLVAQETATDWIARGDQAYQKLDNTTAMEAYQKALEREPENYEALWKLARALVDVGELTTDKDQRSDLYHRAVDMARKAVEVNPNGAKGHLYLSIALGRIALDAGPKERVRLSKEIKAEVDRALELDPNDDLAWHVLGRWHFRVATLSWIEKKFADLFLGGVPKEASVEKAAECFEKAIELNPNHINHYLQLGIVYEKLGRKDDARRMYEKVLEMPIRDSQDPQHKVNARRRLAKLK